MQNNIEPGDIVYSQCLETFRREGKKQKIKVYRLEEGHHYITLILGMTANHESVSAKEGCVLLANAQLIRAEDVLEVFGEDGERKLIEHIQKKYQPTEAEMAKEAEMKTQALKPAKKARKKKVKL